MSHLTFQEKSPSPLVPDDYPGVSDISSSATISSPHDPNVIPHMHSKSHRMLVLCFDGTGDQFGSDNSNVVQFFSMLVKGHPSQLVYYQSGIGTYTIPEIATPLTAKISKLVDAMFGNHLNAHVMGGYEFLMQNYEASDKICIFGFSRGAYTARALAGMVHKVGIIPRSNHQQVPFAYHMYSRDNKKGKEQSAAFKKAFSQHVNIEFIGVWDTVSSVGFIPKQLPFTHGNSSIKVFRHALSLDERRVHFKQCTWKRPNEKVESRVEHDRTPHRFLRHFLKRQDSRDSIESNRSHRHDQCQPSLKHQRLTSDKDTDVEEVWFAGCHCGTHLEMAKAATNNAADVGGGSVDNNTRNSLARIPLRWMIRECFKAEVGILFSREMFKQIGMDPLTLVDPLTLYPHVKKRPDLIMHHSPAPCVTGKEVTDPAIIYNDFKSEELEDVADALSPVCDQLRQVWLWWFLECIPQPIFYQDDSDNHDVVIHRINLGRGRQIRRQDTVGVKVHRSVKIRMEADFLKGGKYRPKAKLEIEPVWVPDLTPSMAHSETPPIITKGRLSSF